MTAWLLAVAFAGSESWVLDDRMWLVDEPTSVSRPLSDWSLTKGYAFQIRDGEQLVGAVVVGEGTWTVRFEQPGEAVATANRMVALEGADAEALAAVAHGEAPLALPVDRGLIVGLDAWDALAPGLVELFVEDGARFTKKDGMHWVVVNHDRRPEAARRIAEAVLRDRMEAWTDERFDPASLIAVDGWDGRADVWIADWRTDRSWDRFAGHEQPGPAQRWLSYLQDPSGAVDPAHEATVFAGAPLAEGAPRHRDLTAARFPLDAEGRPRAPERVDLVQAAARHAFVPEPSHKAVLSEAVADLEVRAVGADQQVVWLDIPHVHQKAWDSESPLMHAWTLDGVSLADGTELEAVALPLTRDQRDGRGSRRTVAVRLPEPLADGETAVLRVAWSDRHRYMRWLEIEDPITHSSRLFGLGANTDLQSAWPRVRTSRSRTVRGEVAVGIPQTLRHVALIGGTPAERTKADGWTWFTSRTTSPQPVLAVGDWRLHETPAVGGMPAVRVLLRNGLAAEDGDRSAWIRQQLALYQRILPDYPEPTVTLVEWMAPTHQVPMYVAPDGVVMLASTRELVGNLGAERWFRNRYPSYEELSVSTGLGVHWWSARGPTTRVDREIMLGAARAYGIASMRALEGDEPADRWLEALTAMVDHQPRFADPFGGSSMPARAAGTLFFARTLPARVGQPAVYAAIDQVLSGQHPASLEGLQAALEATSGQDLQGFVDLWVRTGIAPRVELAWSQEDGRWVGEATADLPFGELDLPVRLHHGDAWTDVVIRLTDGRGTLSVPSEDRPDRVEIDPDRALILATRSVREQAGIAAAP